MKKSIIAILTATVILVSFLGPMLYISTVQGADPSGWYMTVPGVLDSDYYSLYPYETDESLKIGFSQFGEMINSNENVGLEYGEVDPFAPPAGSSIGTIRKVMWLQGWLINITYLHNTRGWRNVWAMAQHSDSVGFGNDWIRVDFEGDWSETYGWEDPKDPGYLIGNYAAGAANYGGRKTNGTAATEAIQVLYDGPRRFVALLTTTVYDHFVYESDDMTSDLPLVKIMYTLIFNKVKKEVIVLKDIKSLVSEKDAYEMKIQFSNRGEVDLGTEATGYHNYFHFFTEGNQTTHDTQIEGLDTCYNSSWELFKTQDPGYDMQEPVQYRNLSAAGPFPQDGLPATFDVAQAINPDAGYAWFAAFWPSLSDWSIDGWFDWWHSLDALDHHLIDAKGYTIAGEPEEPKIPYYIGEWDFILEAIEFDNIQFRGVTVYGVTDHNDGEDAHMAGETSNVIDREVMYQLDEVFNPWDLLTAVHKKNMRWVDFFDGDGTTKTFTLRWPPMNVTWDEYCSFAERVMVDYDESGGFDPDEVLVRDVDYTVDFTAGNITFVVAPPLGEDNIKVLYSTDNVYEVVDGKLWGPGGYEWITVGRNAATVDSAGAALLSATFKQKNITIGIAGEDMLDSEIPNQIPEIMNKFGTGTAMADYKDTLGRAALEDDWCTTWPVTSSNIIGLGGPIAHMLAYYANDFTDAYYDATAGKIVALTCWGKNTYASSTTTGYAVITTYKDINGTVLFLVWGHWGRDTYYASKWFHEGGAEQLQEAPLCLTTIILEIDYTVHEPAVSIVECLGTISETLWAHGLEEKGGIHDP
jgi:hypothetical protein